jgi:hypothetical protein
MLFAGGGAGFGLSIVPGVYRRVERLRCLAQRLGGRGAARVD